MELVEGKRPRITENIEIARNWNDHKVDKMAQSHLSATSRGEQAQNMKKLIDQSKRDHLYHTSNRWNYFRQDRHDAIQDYLSVKTKMSQVVKLISLVRINRLVARLGNAYISLRNKKAFELWQFTSTLKVCKFFRRTILMRYGWYSTRESRLFRKIRQSLTLGGV